MEGVEATGKTVDEAVEQALEELGLERSEVKVEVLSEGRAGLFGLGGGQARVRVVPLPPGGPSPLVESDTELAASTLRHILDLMGVDAEVSVREPETPGDGVGMVKAVLDINGDDLGILIGRRGQTLASLQYLVNLIVSRKLKSHAIFGIDVERYRRRREDSLRTLALRMADRVRQTGQTVTLEPMPANERRIVHLALAGDTAVETGSVGEGENRKVAISRRR